MPVDLLVLVLVDVLVVDAGEHEHEHVYEYACDHEALETNPLAATHGGP